MELRKIKPEKIQACRDFKPDLCETGASQRSNNLSLQTNRELVIKFGT